MKYLITLLLASSASAAPIVQPQDLVQSSTYIVGGLYAVGNVTTSSASVATITGIGAGVTISTGETVTSTLTVQGSAFSVGGSSFSVSGGSATSSYQMKAGNFLATGPQGWYIGSSSFSTTGGAFAATQVITSSLVVAGSTFNVVGGQVLVGTANVVSSGFVPKFAVFSSSMIVSVSTQGGVDVSSGPAPTFSGCGTTPTITAGSNCTRGAVTMTSGLSSACTMTMPASCFAKTPFCIINGGGAGTAVFAQQTANLTLSCDNTTGLVTCGVGTYMTWHCFGN